MAIEATYFSLVAQVLRRLKALGRTSVQALFLSYPDLLLTRAELLPYLTAEDLDRIPTRADSSDIWRWHGLSDNPEPIYDSIAVFERLGVRSTVIDIVAARGVEEIVDLNFPLDTRFDSRFDLVIDTGTCEHCFNVGQAFANACQSVKVGGFLIHAAPMTKLNHGFWNFCPTVYPDFFGDNGFKIHLVTGLSGDLKYGYKTFGVSVGRFKAPEESALFVVAEKEKTVPLTWPMQSKYKHRLQEP